MGTFKIKAFYFLNKLEAVYIAFSSAFFWLQETKIPFKQT